MAKTISLNYNDREFTLEFTRKTCVELERNGFRMEELTEMPLVRIQQLYEGAFLAHHRFDAKPKVLDAIWEVIPDKQDFIIKLKEMYDDVINSHLESAEEGAEGNALWKSNWN